MEATKQQTQSHFILVHGGCHGAWCWYKLKPLLESHGHKVTVLDLAASGINMKKIEEVPTFYDYTVPLMKLMESLPLGEKVILVGHSFGGMSLALAMDKFPEKISVVVFLTAFMPDTIHKPSFVIDQNRSLGAKAGVVLNPATPLTTVEYVLDVVDLVLIMLVNPGFGGQSFIESQVKKISNLRRMCAEKGVNPWIEVDGGVGPKNAYKDRDVY